MEAIAKKRGRPAGIPREGKYGTGVKTKTVRVPEYQADRIDAVFKNLEQVKVLIESWELKISQAASESKTGSSPRTYEQAVRLIEELKHCLEE